LKGAMLNKLLNRIPIDEPALKIGPLQIWVNGYTYENQHDQGDFAYLSTPTLLIADNFVVFSENSQTPVFTFKQFLKDLTNMYQSISVASVVELASRDSEFKLTLHNNLGQIKANVNYQDWSNDGSFEFEEMIDQSYLPKIINEVKSILAKEY
jgi:hypothetical protein